MPLSYEASLIKRAQALDARAIAELYRLHVQPIYRYIYLRVNDAHIAEDLTSEVFLRVLEGLPTYEFRGIPFAAWLFRIAHDRVIDHYRRQARCPELAGLHDSLQCTREDPHETFVRCDEEDEIRTALERLTEDQRLVLTLRFIEHRSLAEVARQLGKTEGAIKALQHRALAALGRILEEKKK